MKISKTCLGSVIFLSAMASCTGYGGEGGVSGGGGGGYVCPSQSASRRVQLLDFTEGRAQGFSISESEQSVESQIDLAFKKLASYSKDEAADFYRDLTTVFRKISASEKIRWLTAGPRLAPPIDTGLTEIPEECYLVGIAHYDDDTYQLTIDKRFYSQLSSTGKAGLWVHETLWWIARNYDSNDTGLELSSAAERFALLAMTADQKKFRSIFTSRENPKYNTDERYYRITSSGSSQRTRAIVGNLFAANPVLLAPSSQYLTAFESCYVTRGWDQVAQVVLSPDGENICRLLKAESDRNTRELAVKIRNQPDFRAAARHGLGSQILEEDGQTPYLIEYVTESSLTVKKDFQVFSVTEQECVAKAREILAQPGVYSITHFQFTPRDAVYGAPCEISFTTVQF